MRKWHDLNVKPIRGNVETRVKKSIAGEYDAVILAEAGLARLGMRDVIVERLNIKDFLPSPGQGAIAIICRKYDKKLIRILKGIEDRQSRAEIDAERSWLGKIEGGCRFPVGAYAVTTDDKYKIALYANVFSADGTNSIKIRKIGDSKEPSKLGIDVANLLIKEGATKLAEGWRYAVEEWNKKL